MNREPAAPDRPEPVPVSEPAHPPAEGFDENDPDWVDVRESWVGERVSEPLPIEAYAAGVLPPPPTEAAPEVAPGYSAPPEVPRHVMPASIPPPLPPSVRPMARTPSDVFEAFALGAARVPERSHAMLDRLAASDYDGALRAAEGVLRIEPQDGEALQCRELCRNELRRLYFARLGDAKGAPRLVVGAAGLCAVDVDLRAGLVLSRVDGVATILEIARSGVVPELDALRILSELLLSGVLAIAPAA